MIGSGGTGKVYLGMFRGDPVAAKEVIEGQEDELRREYENMLVLRGSPYILSALGFAENVPLTSGPLLVTKYAGKVS